MNALVFALLTCILLLISVFSDNWLTAQDVKQGFWKNCTLASSIPSLASSIKANDNTDFFICVSLNKICKFWNLECCFSNFNAYFLNLFENFA